MTITSRPFGTTARGEAVTAFTLQNSRGASVTVLDYGATVQSMLMPDRKGLLTDVVLGYETIEDYERFDGYLGSVIGRVCNRIGKGVFRLNGKEYHLVINCDGNHSHGGTVGFDKRMWTVTRETDALCLSLLSPDGEEGYPGNLRVQVRYRLDDACRLTIAYDAVSDQDTILNMTSHSYFNLSGGGDAMDHLLRIRAERFLQTDSSGLPTGKYLDVEDTPFDFRTERAVSDAIGLDHPQLTIGKGFDHTFVLSGPKAAVLTSPKTGIRMQITTDLPGIQLYTANYLTDRPGKGNSVMQPRNAVCLETQLFPDGMAHYGFPSPVLFAETPVHFESSYAFDVV